MNKKETDKKNLAELIFILVFAIWFFLLLIPYIFDFNSVPMIGKTFMILGSIAFFIMFILVVVGVEIINRKEKYKNKKSVWLGRIAFLLILAFYVLGIFRYFNIKVNIIYTILFTSVGLIGLFSWAYNLINSLKDLVNNEKITVIILSIALFVLILGLTIFGVKSEYGLVLVKVSIGIFYIFLMSVILNFTVFNSKPTIKERYKIFLLAFFIVVGLALLILFPFYVQWWGLSGNNFNFFVTTYSALVGGGLTLLGVAWTIKKADSDRRKDLLAQYTPYLKLTSEDCQTTLYCQCCKNNDEGKYYIQINHFMINNISKNIVIIEGMNIDENFFPCNGDFLSANESVKISVTPFYQNTLLSKIEILCLDVLKNKYTLPCVYDYQEKEIVQGKYGVKYEIKRIELPKLQEK